MHTYLLLASAIFLHVTVYGQIENIPDAYGAPVKAKTGVAIEGSLYYNDWAVGAIVWSDGTKNESVPVRYNIETKQVEIQKFNGSIWGYSAREIKMFQYSVNLYPEIINQTFIRENEVFEDGTGFVKLFYQNDKMKVIEKVEMEVIEAAPSYGTSERTTKLVKQLKYYVKQANDLIQFKRTVSSLTKLYPKMNLKEFIRANNLDLQKDADLSQIFVYIGSVQDK